MVENFLRYRFNRLDTIPACADTQPATQPATCHSIYRVMLRVAWVKIGWTCITGGTEVAFSFLPWTANTTKYMYVFSASWLHGNVMVDVLYKLLTVHPCSINWVKFHLEVPEIIKHVVNYVNVVNHQNTVPEWQSVERIPPLKPLMSQNCYCK